MTKCCQPIPAAREGAEHDRKELRCSRCGYYFCESCSHDCPHCHPATDTSPAAAALLAQGKLIAALRTELLELVEGQDTTLADQIRDLILNLDEGILAPSHDS